MLMLFLFIVFGLFILAALPWANAGAMSIIILIFLALILGGGGRRA